VLKRPSRRTLWRNRMFRRLWAAQGVSVLGSRVTMFALPLTAATLLHASSLQMGLLGFAQFGPWLLVGIPAGVLVDRLNRTTVMVSCDVARALLVAAVPATWLAGRLSYALLLTVALSVGALSVLFTVAYQATLPDLVSGAELTHANSNLISVEQTGALLGPGLAGTAVLLVGAPLTLIADSASYLMSAWFLRRVRIPHTTPQAGGRSRIRHDLTAGWVTLWRLPLVRALTLAGGFGNLFGNQLNAVFVLFALRTHHFSGLALGVTFAFASLGSLSGALAAPAVATRLGVGRCIVVSQLAAGPGMLLIALAGGGRLAANLTIAVGMFVWYASWNVSGVHAVAIRHASVPKEMQGRVAGTARFVSVGLGSLGLIIGGVAGGVIGYRAVIVIASVGATLATIWVIAAGLWGLRELTAERPASLGPSVPRQPESTRGSMEHVIARHAQPSRQSSTDP